MTDNTEQHHGVNTLSLLDAALYYAQFTRVFPLQPNSKLPLLTGSWTTYATQDIQTITQWWNAHPTANIALMAGKDLTVLDLDVKNGKDGVASIRRLFGELGLDIQDIPKPATTPTGGKHVFYKHPEKRDQPFHNATDRGKYGGIDIRSGHAYVLAAPSVLPNGDYRWGGANSMDPLKEIPEIPRELADELDQWSNDAVVDISADQPELLPEPANIHDHPINKLPEHLIRFSLSGESTHFNNDTSAALMSLASRLYILGLDDAQVLTFLAGYPGPSAVAFKRRPGNFESAVSWLWKYSCRKARSNRKLDTTDIQSTFQAVPATEDVPRETVDLEENLTKINTIDDFDKARDYLRETIDMAPMEQAAAVTMLKNKLKPVGITSRAIDAEMRSIQTIARAQHPTQASLVFPHLGDNGRVISHTDNFKAIMDHHNVTIAHNTMSHEFDIRIPNTTWLPDTMLNDQFTTIQDFMERHNMQSARAPQFIGKVAGQYHYHPVLTMLDSVKWDGQDRITPILNALELAEDDEDTRFMRDKLVTTWLVSAIMVLRNYGTMPPRGVLVLAGPQSCGKTSFFRMISPDNCFGEGLHLDVHNKDSLKKAVKYWMVELGEIDSTFKKSEISALKAHISNTVDEIRLPYNKTEDKWPRRTVYSGTVNRVDFLQDYTGNTRFWPVELTRVDLDAVQAIMSGDGVAQFWKQVERLLDGGASYVLNDNEIRALEDHNENFRERRGEEELLRERFEWGSREAVYMTTNEVVVACGGQTVRGHNPYVEPLQKLTGQSRSRRMRRGGKIDMCWAMPPLKQLT